MVMALGPKAMGDAIAANLEAKTGKTGKTGDRAGARTRPPLRGQPLQGLRPAILAPEPHLRLVRPDARRSLRGTRRRRIRCAHRAAPRLPRGIRADDGGGTMPRRRDRRPPGRAVVPQRHGKGMNKGGISARLVPCPVATTTVDSRTSLSAGAY